MIDITRLVHGFFDWLYESALRRARHWPLLPAGFTFLATLDLLIYLMAERIIGSGEVYLSWFLRLVAFTQVLVVCFMMIISLMIVTEEDKINRIDRFLYRYATPAALVILVVCCFLLVPAVRTHEIASWPLKWIQVAHFTATIGFVLSFLPLVAAFEGKKEIRWWTLMVQCTMCFMFLSLAASIPLNFAEGVLCSGQPKERY